MARQDQDRRSAIIEAGYQLIAERGYSGATTAAICAAAGVSSGTFFHYFPTKASLLLGILEADIDHEAARHVELLTLAEQDAPQALDHWRAHLVNTAADPHLAGFVSALGDAPDDPRVTAHLATESAGAHWLLVGLVDAGQRQGAWRSDRPAERLAVWIGVLADGVLTRSVEDSSFGVHAHTDELDDVLKRILLPQPDSD